MDRNDFIEKIIGGIFAVIAVMAAIAEMFINGVSASTVTAGIKDVFGTLAVVVLFLAVVKDKIPSRDFREAFDNAMSGVCEKYKPLIRKETINSNGTDTATKQNKVEKLERTICYQMADNINVIFGKTCNNYPRFLEIENKETTIIKLLIRKSFFNCENYTDTLLVEISNKIKENLELKFRDYSFAIDEKKNEIYINTNRLMSSNKDAQLLADFIDNVVMLYIAESKK